MTFFSARLLGFSGIRNTDRLERHESRRRTMAHVADHLSVLALEQQYRSCTDVTTARHFQTIWLLAKGHEIAEREATVSFARRWVERPMGAIGSTRISGRARVLNHPGESDHASPLPSTTRTACYPH